MTQTPIIKSPGQIAYEEDVRRKPTYDGGTPRKTWDQLSPIVKSTWARNPTPRPWNNFKRTVYGE